MKKLIIIFPFIIFAFISCDEPPIEKPDNLINEKQMIEMMVDVHLAESTYNTKRYDDDAAKASSSANFYYSILEKYQVPDSVFEKSFIFYASNPKDFEKMYRKVMNKLNEIEQDYSGRKNDLLEFDDQQ